MADTKISGLTAFSTPLHTDVLPIADLSASVTKKVTVSNLLKAQNFLIVVAPTGGNKKGADYVCDGSSDQTEIKNAITDANTAGGGTVFLRAGTYTIDGTIIMKSNVRLIGEGFSTKIVGNGATGFSIISSTGTSSGAPLTNIEIGHMKLDGTSVTNGGNYATGVKGIYITYVNNGYFHDIWVYNTYASGIGIDFLVDTVITNNICDSCGRGITDPTTQEGGSGIGIGTGGYTNEPTIIANNICMSNGKYGIFFEGQSGTAGNYFNVSDNIVYSNYHGLGARSVLRGMFDSNISYSNTKQGILIDDSPFSALENTDIRVTNNIFRSNGDYGVKITDNHNNTYIRGNQFSGNTTGAISASASGSMIIEENQGIASVEMQVVEPMKNTSGGSLAAGDVVVIKSVAAGNEVTTTTVGGDSKIYGMASEAISNNATGNIQRLGKTTILKVDGTSDIAIGDYLSAFTTAKIAQKASTGDMAFAIALEAYTSNDSSGVIDALLVTPRKI